MKRKIRIPNARLCRSRTFLAEQRPGETVELPGLPIMLILLSLVVYGGQAYSVQRKVTLAATTVANIFAQANNVNTSTITAAELNQILSYPNADLYPYDASTAAVVVSQLLVTQPTGPRPARSAAAGPTRTERPGEGPTDLASIRRSLRPFPPRRQPIAA